MICFTLVSESDGTEREDMITVIGGRAPTSSRRGLSVIGGRAPKEETLVEEFVSGDLRSDALLRRKR